MSIHLKRPLVRNSLILLNVVLACAWGVIKVLVLDILTKLVGRASKKDLCGRVVLVTGAGNGLGRCVALSFARLGCDVVLWDVDEEGCRATADMVRDEGGKPHVYVCDVRRRNDVYETASHVRRDVGKVDILVNNAAIVSGKFLLDIPDDKIRETFEVNALAHFWMVKAFLPDMMDDNFGHLVFVSSVVGKMGLGQLTDYCASKFAVIGFAESLKRELEMLGFDGIRSSVICPGLMNSSMFAGIQYYPFIPVLKIEDVADTIVEAVATGRTDVTVPSPVKMLVFLKNCITDSMWAQIYRHSGGFGIMKGFRGRTTKQDDAVNSPSESRN